MDTLNSLLEIQDEHKKEYMRRFWHGEIRGALAYNVAEPLEEIKLEPKEGCNICKLFLENRLKDLGRRNWEGKHKIVMINPHSRLSGGGGVMATAFGARYNQEYDHTAPVIDRAEKIESLNLNPTIKDGLIPQALEIIRYFVDKTEGKIPIQMYNAGGPMDIASMVLYDTELMTAIYEHPKQVHRLLEACTNLYIEFYKAQKAIVPDWVPTIVDDMYIPDGNSILCGEDWLSEISVETALEFEVPYINKISEVFGGVAIHSCGCMDHQLEMLKKEIKNLRGIWFNAGTTSFQKAVGVFERTNIVLMPCWNINTPNKFESRIDYVEKLLSMKTDDITVYMTVSFSPDPTVPTEEDPVGTSNEIVEYIEKIKVERKWK